MENLKKGNNILSYRTAPKKSADYPKVITAEEKDKVLKYLRKLKQESTIFAWKLFESKLRKEFWVERTLWSDGYFCCSIGEASPETIRKYIEQQG